MYHYSTLVQQKSCSIKAFKIQCFNCRYEGNPTFEELQSTKKANPAFQTLPPINYLFGAMSVKNIIHLSRLMRIGLIIRVSLRSRRVP